MTDPSLTDAFTHVHAGPATLAELQQYGTATLAGMAARQAYTAALLAARNAHPAAKAELHADAQAFSAAAEALAAAARAESGLAGADQIAAGVTRLADLLEAEAVEGTKASTAHQERLDAEKMERETVRKAEEEIEDQALAVLFAAGPTGLTDPEFAMALAGAGLDLDRRTRQRFLDEWSRYGGVNAVLRRTPGGSSVFVHAHHVTGRD
ncbi:hypothetical protein GCM10010441_45220 [Kitasatospora paracochleata]|uniref:Uncharacterized protein n=1 Tax=Kitasatospora paracochleata TaxID=58354 RepID=A0ABT1JAJ5_9ACTN|nr:hypothetical protein [Kitasatospora paracochleata]MCP2314098.1 hypothetical protein [Kitasatospora paracochleata]